jgi:hypothetical protein
MKAFSTLLVAIMTAAAFLSADDKCPPTKTAAPATAKKGSPFYCNRLALTPEVRKRHFDELGPKIHALRKAVRELKDGYEFEFPGDAATYALLTEWAMQERLCCPFFDISLRLEPENGPVWLRLTGRPGTKAFIKVDGATWIAQPVS